MTKKYFRAWTSFPQEIKEVEAEDISIAYIKIVGQSRKDKKQTDTTLYTTDREEAVLFLRKFWQNRIDVTKDQLHRYRTQYGMIK